MKADLTAAKSNRRRNLWLVLAILVSPCICGCQPRPQAEPLQYSDASVQQIRDRVAAMDW